MCHWHVFTVLLDCYLWVISFECDQWLPEMCHWHVFILFMSLDCYLWVISFECDQWLPEMRNWLIGLLSMKHATEMWLSELCHWNVYVTDICTTLYTKTWMMLLICYSWVCHWNVITWIVSLKRVYWNCAIEMWSRSDGHGPGHGHGHGHGHGIFISHELCHWFVSMSHTIEMWLPKLYYFHVITWIISLNCVYESCHWILIT